MPRQPIKGLAMGPWREREHLRKVRLGGRNQLAHGDNHGTRSARGVSLSPPWRATSNTHRPSFVEDNTTVCHSDPALREKNPRI